jgi:hypothetical protein
VHLPAYADVKSEVIYMPDTGEDREIKQRMSANEAEVIRESKKLVQKAKSDLNARKKETGAWSGRRRSQARK